MAQVYYRLVLSGSRKLEDVPDPWRQQVADLLSADN